MYVASLCRKTHKLIVAPGGMSLWYPRLAAPSSAQPSHVEGQQPGGPHAVLLPYPRGKGFGAKLLSSCPLELPVNSKRGA